jgi:hypothetical protein
VRGKTWPAPQGNATGLDASNVCLRDARVIEPDLSGVWA